MEKRRKVAQRERRRKESSTKKASRMRAEFISFSFALVAWASLLSWLVACGLQPPLTHQKRSPNHALSLQINHTNQFHFFNN
eukprot:UN01726